MPALWPGGRFRVRTSTVSSVDSSCACCPMSCGVNAKPRLSVLTRHVSSGFHQAFAPPGRRRHQSLHVCGSCAKHVCVLIGPRRSWWESRAGGRAGPCPRPLAAPALPAWERPREEGLLFRLFHERRRRSPASPRPRTGQRRLRRGASQPPGDFGTVRGASRAATRFRAQTFASVKAGSVSETPFVGKTRSPFCPSP